MISGAKKVFFHIRASLNEHLYLHLLGCVCAIMFVYLAASSQFYGDADLVDLLGVSFGVAVMSLLACGLYYVKRWQLPFKAILLWACIFRLMGVFSYPVLEDDHYRFLWDGYQTMSAGSPYIAPPSAFFDHDLPEKLEDILGAINYPDVPTIYAPVTQFVFAAAYFIAPAEVWALKGVLLCFDIGLLLLLAYFIRCLASKDKEVVHQFVISWQQLAFLLYAWSPLLVKEVAFTAHPDIIGIFFIVSAWVLQYLRPKQGVCIAILCALAVSSKIFAVLLVPFLLQLSWRRWGVFIVTLGLIFLPFAQDLLALFQSVQTMGQHWIFNAPVYLAFDHYATVFPQYFSSASYILGLAYIKYIGLSIFVMLWLLYFFRFFGLYSYCASGIKGIRCLLVQQVLPSVGLPRGDWIYGVFFLVIPVVNPWYLLWLLPFSVIYPSLWALTASFSVLLSYVIGLNIDDASLTPYGQPGWLLSIEYMIVLLVFWGERRWLNKPLR